MSVELFKKMRNMRVILHLACSMMLCMKLVLCASENQNTTSSVLEVDSESSINKESPSRQDAGNTDPFLNSDYHAILNRLCKRFPSQFMEYKEDGIHFKVAGWLEYVKNTYLELKIEKLKRLNNELVDILTNWTNANSYGKSTRDNEDEFLPTFTRFKKYFTILKINFERFKNAIMTLHPFRSTANPTNTEDSDLVTTQNIIQEGNEPTSDQATDSPNSKTDILVDLISLLVPKETFNEFREKSKVKN